LGGGCLGRQQAKGLGCLRAALGQQVEAGAVTGERALCLCSLGLLSVAREGSRLAQADRSGDVVRAHAAVAVVVGVGVCGGW
jgi:hypothetical protein